MNPTWTGLEPAASASATSATLSSRSADSGFSQKAAMPKLDAAAHELAVRLASPPR